jgi:hypothetical protein
VLAEMRAEKSGSAGDDRGGHEAGMVAVQAACSTFLTKVLRRQSLP